MIFQKDDTMKHCILAGILEQKKDTREKLIKS